MWRSEFQHTKRHGRSELATAPPPWPTQPAAGPEFKTLDSTRSKQKSGAELRFGMVGMGLDEKGWHGVEGTGILGKMLLAGMFFHFFPVWQIQTSWETIKV